MDDRFDRALMKMFLKTGDPYYYTARGILRERNKNGGTGKDPSDSP